MTDAVASEKAAQLRKILELEASKGFTDQAVAGGLDRFLAKWRVELARSLGLDPTQGIPYGRLTPERREAWAERILKRAPGRAALSLPRTDDRRRQTSSAHHPQTSGESRPAEPGPGVSHLIGGPVKHPARAGRHPATTASTQSPPRVPAPRTHRTASLDSAVVDLKLCTQPAAKKLAAMGVVSLRDVLYFFPNRHIDYATVSHIRDLQVGVDASVIATV
ncbi:MAG: hypothetical protein HY682_04835, partial [Chloroflexi bacterium]|nr:hypothetical protein [Chloroflexota bacterium]